MLLVYELHGNLGLSINQSIWACVYLKFIHIHWVTLTFGLVFRWAKRLSVNV